MQYSARQVRFWRPVDMLAYTLQLSCRLQAIKPASGRGGAAEQQLMSHGSHGLGMTRTRPLAASTRLHTVLARAS